MRCAAWHGTRGPFPRLRFTGPEVEAVAAIYKERTKCPAIICTGTGDYRLKHLQSGADTPPDDRQRAIESPGDDNERDFRCNKALPAPPRVLHLATHGFFLEKSDRTDRPMTLSGLALAGANLGMKGETDPDGEDGILYALEAQNLNLEGTELVVLSACDTGKGEVDYSEGVYGLTRAFRTAGARNILMTLWPLHDELAKEFMVDFYRNWLSGASGPSGNPTAKTPAEALRETRLAWIESKDERKCSPRYWAPYVLIE
uniref:CHAT domain-containing protein n=1 Tax=Candidatus Kentrum sp. TC TaxID=2126339 RepID=A0A450ZUA1_9GAMM|nr:MAG: CHAT domain-containing protein [Candidatus Kentron sp. TC]